MDGPSEGFSVKLQKCAFGAPGKESSPIPLNLVLAGLDSVRTSTQGASTEKDSTTPKMRWCLQEDRAPRRFKSRLPQAPLPPPISATPSFAACYVLNSQSPVVGFEVLGVPRRTGVKPKNAKWWWCPGGLDFLAGFSYSNGEVAPVPPNPLAAHHWTSVSHPTLLGCSSKGMTV